MPLVARAETNQLFPYRVLFREHPSLSVDPWNHPSWRGKMNAQPVSGKPASRRFPGMMRTGSPIRLPPEKHESFLIQILFHSRASCVSWATFFMTHPRYQRHPAGKTSVAVEPLCLVVVSQIA